MASYCTGGGVVLCRKRAGEEYKKKEDVRNKKEVEERCKQQAAESESTSDSRPISKK